MTRRATTLVRLATILAVVVTVAMLALSVPVVLATGSPQSSAALVWPIPFAAMALVGAFVANGRPRISTGWLFLGAGLLMVSNALAQDYALYASGRGLTGVDLVAWLAAWTWMPATVLIALILIVFPDGRARSRFWRWVARIGVLLCLAIVAAALPMLGESASVILAASSPSSVPGGAALGALSEGPAPAFLPLAFIALVNRFVRSRGVERQQMKWFVFGASVLAGSTLIMFLVSVLFGVQDPIANPIAGAALGLGMTALPASAAIAILRHRLYDIDVVINRTVLFGLLAAFVTAVYIGIVVGFGALIGSRENLFLSILATALIAVLFQPVQNRARHLANRLVYGKRATPYELLSEFADRVAGSYAREDVLPRMARLVGEGTGAERATIWLRVGDHLRPAAMWPAAGRVGAPVVVAGEDLPTFPPGEHAFPVRDGGQVLGALAVVLRSGESLTPTNDKLLRDLAGQAALILRNVRLIEELRASRQRLVSAQDVERRRLERNIHDGAQQQLVALSVKMRLLKTLARKDPGKAEELVDQLQADALDALDDLRDLARGIYPPLLADQGLVSALEAQARKAAIPVEVDPDGVGRYPQEAEATAYFCVLEALQNV
ncbi:MAG: GAF domain-containing sensor histidine kinase, partial [Actinomycetota bacterium]